MSCFNDRKNFNRIPQFKKIKESAKSSLLQRHAKVKWTCHICMIWKF